MYRIVELADGTAEIRRGGNGMLVTTCASVAEAQAWVEEKILDMETSDRAQAKGMSPCPTCGAPRRGRPCRECV
jgi:hypothetical protein